MCIKKYRIVNDEYRLLALIFVAKKRQGATTFPLVKISEKAQKYRNCGSACPSVDCFKIATVRYNLKLSIAKPAKAKS